MLVWSTCLESGEQKELYSEATGTIGFVFSTAKNSQSGLKVLSEIGVKRDCRETKKYLSLSVV